jgi:hypothetical protein
MEKNKMKTLIEVLTKRYENGTDSANTKHKSAKKKSEFFFEMISIILYYWRELALPPASLRMGSNHDPRTGRTRQMP